MAKCSRKMAPRKIPRPAGENAALRNESIVRKLKCPIVVFLIMLGLVAACAAQPGGATGAPLVVSTAGLPKAYVHQAYEFRLRAEGGILPLRWELTDGSLPRGVQLRGDGVLSGSPEVTGQFKFTVTVRDSGKPAYERKQELTLVVVAPLLAEWKEYPKVNGQRIEGSIKVSNQTEEDMDLTVIVVAVNPIGRATALGYQHFPLKKGTADLEIPFGENLPPDPYDVNVDAVGEVQATNSIYRARLVTSKKLRIQQGP